LFANSMIDTGMIQAYAETHYRVFGDEPFTLCVGEASARLAVEHHRHDVTSSAYVTACNPFSRMLSADDNAERHAALAVDLEHRGLAAVEGIGEHPSNRWLGEPSFLVFGLDLAAAKVLGSHLEQNAIVWSGADAVPQLILLR